MKEVKLSQEEYGYYTLANKPSKQELEEYYEAKYFQETNGAYENAYSKEEKKYFENKLKEKEYIISNYDKHQSFKSIIDIGCGEGWALSFFKKRGWDVTGLDYSDFAVRKYNPTCLNNLVKGDIIENLKTLIRKHKKFDVVYLGHVFEHLLEPVEAVLFIKKILKKNGLLIISVPNDFSKLHEYLISNNKIEKKFWVTAPDHISYFNRDSLNNLMVKHNFEEFLAIGDYAIDLDLINPNTNYVKNKSVGKSCYHKKIEFENFLHETNSIDKVVEYYAAQINIGLGRSFTGFYSLKK